MLLRQDKNAAYWNYTGTSAIIGNMDTDTTPEARPHHLSVIAELEHRIHELEHIAEEQFGSFTWFDWLLCIGGALLLPYLCYVWFWP